MKKVKLLFTILLAAIAACICLLFSCCGEISNDGTQIKFNVEEKNTNVTQTSEIKGGAFCVETQRFGLTCDYYSSYCEMADVIDSIKLNVVSSDEKKLLSYINSNKHNSSAILVCPFLFSSSEEGAVLSDVHIVSNELYVTFDVYSPQCCDADVRMYVFFVRAADLSVKSFERMRVKYVINNLAGGQGSYYYD